MDLLILLGSFVVILAGAELFTNGIEWFGRKLGLAEGAVGSVLAAVGTALPETMIPIVAILFSGEAHSDEIGVGAILGAPFMLATLAMFVTGLAVVVQARNRAAGDVMPVDTHVLGTDMRTFVVAYGLAIAAAAFLPSDPAWPKIAVAILLLVIYGWYVKGHFEADPAVDVEDLAPLRFHRFDGGRTVPSDGAPRLRVVNLQVLVALGLIVGGAVAFVDAVGGVASSLGVSEVLLALVIAPIATELPEKFNSIIWV
ncbi:MAG: sodium:calcium antiporter, partial [Chloroflexi bacterium]|nr:sodium:calcium antiporter [Chloroflexota bacterium]